MARSLNEPVEVLGPADSSRRRGGIAWSGTTCRDVGRRASESFGLPDAQIFSPEETLSEFTVLIVVSPLAPFQLDERYVLGEVVKHDGDRRIVVLVATSRTDKVAASSTTWLLVRTDRSRSRSCPCLRRCRLAGEVDVMSTRPGYTFWRPWRGSGRLVFCGVVVGNWKDGSCRCDTARRKGGEGDLVRRNVLARASRRRVRG